MGDGALSARAQVGAVYNHSNVWANVQVAAGPWEVSWQLNDARCWKPLFGPQVRASRPSRRQAAACVDHRARRLWTVMSHSRTGAVQGEHWR